MNVAENIGRAAKFFPDKTAVIFEGARISYEDLNARVNRLANALKANNIRPGRV